MKRLLLLDLDRTLFRTLDFWNDFAAILAKHTHESVDTYQNHYELFNIGEGLLRTVDYEAILGRADVSADIIAQEVRQQLSHKDYLYTDARNLLGQLESIRNRYDVGILTYGQKQFQELKFDITPELASLPRHIIYETKSTYIARAFSDYAAGSLVDDKPGQQLPANWQEIHIDRTAAKHAPPRTVGPHTVSITTLEDVLEFL